LIGKSAPDDFLMMVEKDNSVDFARGAKSGGVCA
jgi:hypothetical protein